MFGSDTSNVHRLVLMHGRERARTMVPEKQRPLVDIAAEVMADESQRMGEWASATRAFASRPLAGNDVLRRLVCTADDPRVCQAEANGRSPARRRTDRGLHNLQRHDEAGQSLGDTMSQGA